MAFTFTSPEKKWSAVKEALAGGDVTEVADSYGVSRPTIYHWLNVAEQGALAAFARDTPGKRTVSLEEEARRLREQLQYVLSEYHQISTPSRPVPSPPVCPNCQSVQVCRNGKVLSKSHGLRQRFWCRRCSVSIYVDLKKTP